MVNDLPTGVSDRLVEGLFEVVHRVHQVVSLVADRYDLTPQQVGLLRSLGTPMSMRVFAEDLSCDPSNVTGLIDRAERLGLVERLTDPLDRRVRILTLTAKGRRTRSRVNKDLAAELSDVFGSAAGERDQLDRFLRTINLAS
jgi:DNA-binding MarR family transcriptional regulator